jgi:hypothetical protein
MSQTTNVLTQTAPVIDFVAARIASLKLFTAFGALERKTSASKKAAIEAAVAYMQAAKMDYATEQVFKTDCIMAQAGKGATKEQIKTCRDSLNTALKLYPAYVAAVATTPKAQEMAKKRGGAQSAADKKAAEKLKKQEAANAKKTEGAVIVKGKSQSAAQEEIPADTIRFDHILADVTRSMQGIHSHVQMHLKPSQLSDYNKAQTEFLLAVAKLCNK